VRFAREFGVERFEALGGGAKKEWRVAATHPHEGDLRAQALDVGAFELLERRALCERE
jgi:hypothetical protein